MSDPISEYQRWKQQGAELRSKAKQAIEARFRELFTEAIQLSEEYKQDFGKNLAPPASVTAFRYKSASRPAVKNKTAVSKKTVAPKPLPVTSPLIPGLLKKLQTAKKKLESARTSGTPSKHLEDRIYEIEDDIRIAQTP